MTQLNPDQLATALGHIHALARALEDERARSRRYRAAWISATDRARRHKDGWDGGIDLVRRLEAERDHLADRVCACGGPHYCQSEINDLTARITAQLEGDVHDRARHNLARAEKAEAELRNCAATLVHNTERARSAVAERDELVAAHQSDERNWVALYAERDALAAKLARVQALCDRHAVTHQIVPGWIVAVRAALNDDQEDGR